MCMVACADLGGLWYMHRRVRKTHQAWYTNMTLAPKGKFLSNETQNRSESKNSPSASTEVFSSQHLFKMCGKTKQPELSEFPDFINSHMMLRTLFSQQ